MAGLKDLGHMAYYEKFSGINKKKYDCLNYILIYCIYLLRCLPLSIEDNAAIVLHEILYFASFSAVPHIRSIFLKSPSKSGSFSALSVSFCLEDYISSPL